MSKLFRLPYASTNTSLPTLVDASAEIADYSSRILTNSGAGNLDAAILPADLTAIAQFILGLKYAVLVSGSPGVNLFTKIKSFFPLAGNSLDAARTRLVGATTATVTGFVAGDYTRTGGLVSDASTKSFNLNVAPTSFGSDNLGLMIYSLTGNDNGSVQDVLNVGFATGQVFGISARSTSGMACYAYTSSGAGFLNPSLGGSSAGVLGWNRTATTLTTFKNSAILSTSGVGGARSAVNIQAFRGAKAYGGAMITEGCTDAEFAYIQTQFRTLMTAFGR